MKKMKKWKLVLLILGGIFLILQFIRPDFNDGDIKGENDIYSVVDVPKEVDEILVKACYDCHSNHTEYPWYANIQPIGWWIQDHVDEGKEELNFSEFGKLKKKGQLHKLHECEELIEADEMPLNSYLWMHSNAKLTTEEKEIMYKWVKRSQQFLVEGNVK